MSTQKVKKSGNANGAGVNSSGGGGGANLVVGGGGDGPGESRWRLRQRVDAETKRDHHDYDHDDDNNSSEESKPTVVDVYPKKNDPNLVKSSTKSTAIKSKPAASSSSSIKPTTTTATTNSLHVITDQSINHESTCSASIVGADCEDTEFTLDWQYPKVNNGKLDSDGTVYFTSENNYHLNGNRSNQSNTNCKESISRRKRSQSTGYLRETNDNGVDHSMNNKNDMRSSENWTQFLLKSRGSSMTSLNETPIGNGFGKSLDPIDQHGLGHGSSASGISGGKLSCSSQISASGKGKNLGSSLQSYFFSGEANLNSGTTSVSNVHHHQSNPGQSVNVIKTSSSSSHSSSRKSKSDERESSKKSLDSSKSFPLPNVFKKNFIVKGHGNCGLFSGVTESTKGSSSSSTSSERSSDHISKSLVHREIAKEIGAFY